MTAFDMANGAVLLAAIFCAAGVPKHMRALTLALAGVFALNWLNFVMSFTAYSLAELTDRAGWLVASKYSWMILDTITGIFGLACGVGTSRWWGPAIWVVSIVQVVVHGLYWDAGAMARVVYYPMLNGLFLVQAAIFIMSGGRGVVSRIGRCVDRLRVRGLGGATGKRVEASS